MFEKRPSCPRCAALLLPILSLLLPAGLRAAEADFFGDWTIQLTDGERSLVGLLEVEETDGNVVAFLEGGPVRIEVDGDALTVWADSRDVRGFVFDRKLSGRLEEGVIRGTYTQEGAAAQTEAGGPWRAEKLVTAARSEPLAPTPVDLSGTWAATQALDFRKYSMALTDAGKAWLDSYLPYYDQPDVRCASIGLPALATYTFPFEIIAADNRLTFIYEYQSRVRRIWLDGREPGPYMPPSRMGHSNGRWEGGTLVIETTNLDKTVRDFRGELISENARIEERYSLSENGKTLSAVITVHDPENYARPPVRRRQWVLDNDAEIFPYTCDPDSFYLTMYEDGELDMYIERTDKRF